MVGDASNETWWRRFLDQATSVQKLLIALGGIATAVLAIGALVVAVGNLVDDDDTDRSKPVGVGALADLDGTTIRSKTAEADELIAGLLAVAASESKTVHLGLKVLADASQPALDSADIKVYFNCSPGPCSRARLQFPRNEGVETNPLGFDLTGTWEVRLARGIDFQSTELDITLQRTSGS
jgi:hypothetical protein